MTDRTSDLFYEQSFASADTTSVPAEWTVDGDLQVINQTLRQGTSGTSLQATAAATLSDLASGCRDDFAILTTLACNDATADKWFTISLRGDTTFTDGYGVRLVFNESTGVTLKIIKVEDSVETDVSTTTVTTELNLDSSSDWTGVFQQLGARIYDTDGAVVVEAFLNDEERPRLTYTDTKYPLWRRSKWVSLIFDDRATDGGSLFLDYVALQVLSNANEETSVAVHQYTFGKLKEMVRSRALRDSSSLVDDEFFGDLVNEAIQEMAEYVGRPSWLRDEYSFVLGEDDTEYEMPPDTIAIDDVVWDTANNNPIPVMNDTQFRQLTAQETTGRPYIFRVGGFGKGGGLMLLPHTAPNADITYKVIRHKHPRLLLNSSDIPDVPQNLCPGLVWGALNSYAMRDSDRTHIQASASRWRDWLRRARRFESRRASATEKFTISHAFRRPSAGLGNNILDRARYGVN